MKPVVLVIIGLVLGAIVGIAIVAAPILPPVSSQQASRTDDIYDYMIVVCGLIFGVVTVVLVYSVFKFRGKHGDLSDGPPIHGVTWLEATWTVIPFLIVTSIVIVSVIVLSRNDQSQAAGRINVDITGFQFGWKYDYIDPDVDIKGSDELVIPVNRPVRLNITTMDVIHSWWVPDFRVQMNATPGQTNVLSVTPTEIGKHALVCAFLCGIGHAAMNSEVQGSIVKEVNVVSAADYDKWVAQKKQAQQQAASAPNAAGVTAFTGAGCGGCHTLAAAQTNGAVGPALEPDTLAAAAKEAGEPVADFVKESIVTPNKHVADGFPSGVMPQDYGEKLPPDQLDAIVALLAGGAN